MKSYGNRRKQLVEIYHPDIGLNNKSIYLDEQDNYRCSECTKEIEIVINTEDDTYYMYCHCGYIE